jgi:hypothetical protein
MTPHYHSLLTFLLEISAGFPGTIIEMGNYSSLHTLFQTLSMKIEKK